jgi:xanthine dehydrogenase small subunit
MTSPEEVVFLLNGKEVRVVNCDPTMTLLDYLRECRRLTGTKEGCREGDCGACTVVEISLSGGRPRVRALNSCIAFLPTLDGSAIFTVEGVASDSGLHPIQQHIVDRHGSQCGFCTPGFVMSLFAADLNQERPSPMRLNEILSGNLCRCTGYRPIADAAHAALYRDRLPDRRIAETLEQLTRLERSIPLDFSHRCPRRGDLRYSAPRSLNTLTALLAQSPRATILAGGTDVGLWVTKQHRTLQHIIDITHIAELQIVRDEPERVIIGAAVTYTDVRLAFARHFPDFAPLIARIASEPIRNSGTVGGNIANGSPIGDIPPALISLGASIALASPRGERRMLLEDFFLTYGKQDRAEDEVLVRIEVPKLAPAARFRTFKISKRFDQDISALCGAFHAELQSNRLSNVRICFGGMAGTPRRARAVERVLEGSTCNPATLERAVTAFPEDYSPLTDHRASAEYRLLVAQNLLRKFFADLRSEHVTMLDREFVP